MVVGCGEVIVEGGGVRVQAPQHLHNASTSCITHAHIQAANANTTYCRQRVSNDPRQEEGMRDREGGRVVGLDAQDGWCSLQTKGTGAISKARGEEGGGPNREK